MTQLGIPRSLFYYYYYPGWRQYFKGIGVNTVLSPPTNKKILDKGVKLAVDDLCLPFKIYFGHIDWLIEAGVDSILVPRLISFGKGNKFCPKFMGLPDMIRTTFNKKLPDLIEPTIDHKLGLFPFRNEAHQIGKRFGVNIIDREYSYWQALNAQKSYKDLLQQGYTPFKLLNCTVNDKTIPPSGEKDSIETEGDIRVVLLGHNYILNDDYMSMGLISKLQEMGVECILPDMLEENKLEKAAQHQSKHLFWYYNRQIMGAAYHYLNQDSIPIDGLIQVTAFGCGPDSLVGELITLKGKNKIAILNINLDEQSGRAGLETRLEAFVDLLQRRKGA